MKQIQKNASSSTQCTAHLLREDCPALLQVVPELEHPKGTRDGHAGKEGRNASPRQR